MKVTWIGQSGYIFESNGYRLVIDPYLSDVVERRQGLTRLSPAPLTPEALRPDAVFITHNHLDHFDPETVPAIHWAFTDCQLAGPQSVMYQARTLGIREEVLVPMPLGSGKVLGPFTLTTTFAYHSDPFAVGLLLGVADELVYISGDTEWWPELAGAVQRLAGRTINAVFIVINGRLGNMTTPEAVNVVREIRPRVAFPMHYGTFAENTADPLPFLEGCRKLGIHAAELLLGWEMPWPALTTRLSSLPLPTAAP